MSTYQEKVAEINAVTDWFNLEMKRGLLLNISRPGWKGEPLEYLLKRLDEELAELKACSLELRESIAPAGLSPGHHRQMIKEAADVANFAMMIADNSRREILMLEKLATLPPDNSEQGDNPAARE